jgi:hypothetical protein
VKSIAGADNSRRSSVYQPPVNIQSHPQQFIANLENLIQLYEHVLVQERCRLEETVAVMSLDEYRETEFFACDYCGADIFQSFFECRECISSGSEDPIVICTGCYAEGRSCKCANMTPRQRRPFGELEELHSDALAALESAYKITKTARVAKDIDKLSSLRCLVAKHRRLFFDP